MHTDEARTNGLAVRQAVIDVLASDQLACVIAELQRSGGPGMAVERALPPDTTALIRKDMVADPGWHGEYWLFRDNSRDVHPVEADTFFGSRPDLRFSRNACLRKPDPQSLALRGLLSAITSAEALGALSTACGIALTFASADIAAYRKGDYLHRHGDEFDNRCLGLVWFLDESPPDGGGELVVEGPSGECTVITPRAGTIVVIPIRSAYTHLVATIRSDHWVRYSIAAHFSRTTTDK